MRKDNRPLDALRPVKITTDWIKPAKGSVLIEMGDTKVVCTASVDEKTPNFLVGTGQGWVTAEYGMLPASTLQRRENSRYRADGRSQEIQRLIGRSLRAVTDLTKLGPRTVWLDCDVLQADGGTRTASITGAYIALEIALKKLFQEGLIEALPLVDTVAAVSVGIVNGACLLDLDYSEDSIAEVDMNIVMTGGGRFVEVQGSAEKATFDDSTLNELLSLAKKGIRELTEIQKNTLKGV
jgi:ribonuclease PH